MIKKSLIKYFIAAILMTLIFLVVRAKMATSEKKLEKTAIRTEKNVREIAIELANESPKIDFMPAQRGNASVTDEVSKFPNFASLSTTDQVLETLKKEPLPDITTLDVFTLDVPADKQEFKNSCEESALQMVLAYYDIDATEMEIVQNVGYKPRNWDKTKNIWDDPSEMFVGSITGKDQNGGAMNGYGTYAPAIAKAARAFGRDAQSYSPVTAEFIADQIYQGYPVIVWGFFRTPPYTKYEWFTEAGKKIEGYRGEHTRVITGVIGDRNKPTGFYLNDPLTGAEDEYWSAERLMKHMNIWGNLTNQAVVVK